MAEDRISKKELGGDIGAGAAGALLGALMSPMFARQAGVTLTQQVGKSLYENRDRITGPIFSRLSKEDERMFEALVIKLSGLSHSHQDVPFVDILNLLMKRMGPWASDRYRSIAIGIPNPPVKTKKVRLIEKQTGDITDTEESSAPVNPQVQFLVETIDDVIRFGGTQVGETPPKFEQGINTVLENLRIRNIVDADSAAAKISRWWNEPDAYKVADEYIAGHIRDLVAANGTADKESRQFAWFPIWIFMTLIGNGSLVKPSLWPFKSNHHRDAPPITRSRR